MRKQFLFTGEIIITFVLLKLLNLWKFINTEMYTFLHLSQAINSWKNLLFWKTFKLQHFLKIENEINIRLQWVVCHIEFQAEIKLREDLKALFFEAMDG